MMTITITATDQVTTIDGVAVRVWDGRSEDGVPCKVFIHRIAVADGADSSRFERELLEKLPPARHLPLGLIL